METLQQMQVGTRLCAPVEGQCIDITEVDDPVFNTKILGDGIAICPETNLIKAPCDGVISNVYRSKNAFVITANDGTEILVHAGINTINDHGKGFRVFVKINQEVCQGSPVMEFNTASMNDSYDMTVMMLVSNEQNCALDKCSTAQRVSCQDEVMSVKQNRSAEEQNGQGSTISELHPDRTIYLWHELCQNYMN